MIAYLDSSVLVRAYLADEDGHEVTVALLDDPDVATVTGTWTRIEVSGALVRAARTGRAKSSTESRLLALLDADLGAHGPVTVLAARQEEVEKGALRIVREHAVRAMDAWHLAVAQLVLPPLLERGEEPCFASRDAAQSAAAEALGLRSI